MNAYSIGLFATCAAALALPGPPPASAAAAARFEVAALRREGPAALDRLLARYDQLGAGPARGELATQIDAVAGQRYATWSRLYWYTDLDAAQAAARAADKPILALRLLGRLDEDLSCANSRLFRATLYANREVSAYLREHFVLYWSSERPVPVVTIDFGDGRQLVRTTTGNSAHYVLDADGHVLDVLPSLYAPGVFTTELARSVALAAEVRGQPAPTRARIVAAHHAKALAASTALSRTLGGQVPAVRARNAVGQAQDTAMSKSRMELPDLRTAGFDVGALSDDDRPQWTALGMRAWPATSHRLDARSRSLIAALHNSAGPTPATPSELAAMIAQLEADLAADTALAELRLRPAIRRLLLAAGPAPDFDALNRQIYAQVFHTPRSDAWLGLLPRTQFTGLPGDGVVTR